MIRGRAAETLYESLIRLVSKRETNPNGIIQSREVAELLIAVRSVDLAHALTVEHDEQFESALKESLQCRHPFAFFLKTVRGIK